VVVQEGSVKDITKKIMLMSAAQKDSLKSTEGSTTCIDEDIVAKKKGEKKTSPILAMFEKTIAKNTEKGVDCFEPAPQ